MPPDTDLPTDVSTMNAQQVGRAGEHHVAADIHRHVRWTLYARNLLPSTGTGIVSNG